MRQMCILEKLEKHAPGPPSALAPSALDPILAAPTLNCFRRACMLLAPEVCCIADAAIVNSSPEQTEGLWENPSLNSGYRFMRIEKSGRDIGWNL